eukprot:COSAG01_NODE_7532_length_3163_cov_51.836815_1_plen_214_part_00
MAAARWVQVAGVGKTRTEELRKKRDKEQRRTITTEVRLLGEGDGGEREEEAGGQGEQPTATQRTRTFNGTQIIHLTIERPTKGRFANVSHNIARLVQAIFLKLQESNFLLYATRFSMMRSLVKRLGMGLPNNLSKNQRLSLRVVSSSLFLPPSPLFVLLTSLRSARANTHAFIFCLSQIFVRPRINSHPTLIFYLSRIGNSFPKRVLIRKKPV